MAERAVLIAHGTDRPGVLDELSQFLLECGGNIADIRTINLRGQFALLMEVHGEKKTFEAIRAGLSGLTSLGIAAELHAAEGGTDSKAFPFVFVAAGKDKAGVLQRLSHLFRVMKVNIENIRSRLGPEESFELRLEISVPRETPITMLREYLTFLCNELGISGNLKEA